MKSIHTRQGNGTAWCVPLIFILILCFRDEKNELYKKFLNEVCSPKSTQIQQHVKESHDWNKFLEFMVDVSI